TDCYVDMAKVVRETIREAGYIRAKYGIDWETCGVMVSVDEQSPDIARGVDTGGAGDQGMMFGYACDETPELMPAPIQYAHNITRRLAQARREGTLKYLRPDGKSQVTVEYENDQVKRVHTVVVSAQHSEEVDHATLADDVREVIVEQVIPGGLIDKDTIFHVNPTGRFVIGGPQADAGLTGRKIIVDTYGGYARHGGGAFSGKDPSKVDRSGAYAARYVAKNVVAAGLARRCEVQIAYAIGVVKPVSVLVETFGTETVDVEAIKTAIDRHFDLSPFGIMKQLDLRRPIFKQTATYGHFGRSDLDLPWERTDLAAALAEDCKVAIAAG
ncbi:MAG TPA: methionine adenosyltransferase, partial [Candidatus Dormibacteraeota bacterium]|nr:methionine adenosyltransferase [Candidatus Dormibacteraeota bacterium]